MSASNSLENSILLLLFNNTSFAGIGDAGGLLKSVADGNLYVSLHTADPGEAGDQTTSECAYTSYARVAVARTAAGWTVAANVVTNAAAITFPKSTGAAESIASHFGIGTVASSGVGILLFSAALTDHLHINLNITPQIALGALSVTND